MKEPTITLKGREWDVYNAGVEQGKSMGIKGIVSELRSSLDTILNKSKTIAEEKNTEQAMTEYQTLEAWIKGFEPWTDQAMVQSKDHHIKAMDILKVMPKITVNLRERVHSAIVGAVNGFRKV